MWLLPYGTTGCRMSMINMKEVRMLQAGVGLTNVTRQGQRPQPV
jgi:hypothetical protein